MIVPETPEFLGKKSWRKHQKEAVESALSTSKEFVIIEAPTGAGKTVIGMAILALLGRGVYVVETKELQEQIRSEFPWVAVLKGRNEYPCALNPKLSAEVCVAEVRKKKCPVSEECSYKLAKRKAAESSVVLLNYAYFLHERNFGPGIFDGREVFVFDEAHVIERELMSFVSLELPEAKLRKLGIGLPEKVTKPETWSSWALENLPKVKEMKESFERAVRATPPHLISPRALDELAFLERLEKKMQILPKLLDSGWVFDRKKGYRFRPVWVSKYSDRLFPEGGKKILMSATILDPRMFARSVGIPEDRIHYIKLPSLFRKEIRPVILMPVAPMSRKARGESLKKVIRVVDRILEAHEEEKGIIHTHSWELASAVMEESKHKERLVTHFEGKREEVIEKWRKENSNRVLVSPSVETGLDCPDDAARFGVIVKLPFPDLSDPVVKKRFFAARRWYTWQSAMNFIQECGRVCLPEGERVIRADGMPIPIEEVKEGDRVIGSGRIAEVKKVMRREYDGEIVEIRAAHLLPGKLTPEHPLLVARRAKCKYNRKTFCRPDCSLKDWYKERRNVTVRCDYEPELMWIEAGDLNKEDYWLAVPIPSVIADKSELSIDRPWRAALDGEPILFARNYGRENKALKLPVDSDFLFLLGAFIAEGSTGNEPRGEISLAFGRQEDALVAEVLQACEKLGLRARVCEREHVKVVVISHKGLCPLLRKMCGERAFLKRIPELFLYLPRDKSLALLRGLIAGDGYVDDKRLYLSTTSPQLATQVWMLLMRLGLLPTITRYDARVGKAFRLDSLRPGYTIVCRNPEYTVRADMREDFKGKWGFIYRGVMFVPIRYVKRARYKGVVYNLETETRTYLTPFGEVHNCRHEEDFGVNYVLDADLTWWIKEAWEFLPSWFAEALAVRRDFEIPKKGGEV